MITCPSCGVEIGHLLYWEGREQLNEVYYNGEILLYEPVKETHVSDDRLAEYECPECREVIVTGYKEAILFLIEEEEK